MTFSSGMRDKALRSSWRTIGEVSLRWIAAKIGEGHDGNAIRRLLTSALQKVPDWPLQPRRPIRLG